MYNVSRTLFLAWYAFRRVGLYFFDDGFDLFQAQVGCIVLLFLRQFVVTEPLFDIYGP
jgi:hypothetical protein